MAVVMAAAATGYGWSAVRLVPPQVDHDLEVQATGYGLLTRFEPLLLTDRHTTYYFAHPPLLHIVVGVSFALAGKLDALKVYDDASRRAHQALAGNTAPVLLGDTIDLDGNGPPHVPVAFGTGKYELAPVSGGPAVSRSIEIVELARIYTAYRREPHRLATRLPNVLFAALTVGLLALLAERLSGSSILGAMTAMAYGTSPEVVVRSSYGGYFAIGSLASLLMLMAWARTNTRFDDSRRFLIPALCAGAFAALSDHKMAMLPIAMILLDLAAPQAGTRRTSPWLRIRGALTQPVVLGFGLGTAAFWAYGMTIHGAAFIEDHLRSHLIDRIVHTNPLGYQGYPSPPGLWLEFARNTGFLLLPAGLSLGVTHLFRAQGQERRNRVLWLVWMLLVALSFTLVDWRMTKHLMPLCIPLFLSLMPPAGARPVWRYTTATVLVTTLAWNILAIRGLVSDFTSFTVTPAW